MATPTRAGIAVTAVSEPRTMVPVDPPARPRIVLVNPESPLNMWSYTEARDIVGRDASMVNLALPTLAALTPAGFDVRLVDENIEAVDTSLPCDVVGITGYVTQSRRIIEIAEAFRAEGRLVVIGGPFASLEPGRVRPYADVLFVGEAEETWPRFLEDYRAGAVSREYAAPQAVALDASPVPRFDLVANDRYGMGVLQTSRGCPFACEFCDVIVYLGRRQRHKTPEQIERELDRLYTAGYRTVFLSDDNFTASPRKATAIVRRIAEWRKRQAERVSFVTQLSIDVADERNAEMLATCVDAGLEWAFVGIESADEESLLEVRKTQNTRRDLLASVAYLQSVGIQVMAGMIVGFDADTVDCFERQYEFARAAGVPMVSVSMLNAPAGTPLEARIRKEGRLLGDVDHDFYFSTNMTPLRMTSHELAVGTRWLMNRLYTPAAFLERLRLLASRLPERGALPATKVDVSGAVALWGRTRRSFATLGPAYAGVPSEAMRAFAGRDVAHAVRALTFYRHVVGALARWQLLDPAVGETASVREALAAAARPEQRRVSAGATPRTVP
jgi:radical SAM superfamily enzyme YgiQ (UPF0313 family)